MKKTFFILAVALIASLFAKQANAQNVQLMYDTERAQWTSTVEMFRPDSFGSTYFFVDLDYNPTVVGAYWEISRELCFWKDTKLSWLSAHIEYNGGIYCLNNWLAGATYSGHSADYSKTWSLTASYKAIPGLKDAEGNCRMHTFQITGVWGISFAKGWCDFSGFFDFWRENQVSVFISEPQFWVNLNKIKGWENVNLSLGGEVELSANFAGMKGFHVMPALGAKWTF